MGKGTEQKKAPPREDDVWARAFRRLVPWTVKRHNVSPSDAEELVQEGIAQLIRSGRTIDLEDFTGLLAAVGSRINGIAVNLRRKKAVQAVLLTSDGSFDDGGDENRFEESLIDDNLARRAVNIVLERIANDELVFSIVGLMAEEVYEPAEQAKRLERAVGDIYNARRRLSDHASAVRKQMEAW